MVDYPHASAACLCYLDEREKGKGGGRRSGGGGGEGQTEGERAKTPDVKMLRRRLFQPPPACRSVHAVLLSVRNRQTGGGLEKKKKRGSGVRGWKSCSSGPVARTSPLCRRHFKALSGVNCCGPLHSE